MKYQGAKNNSVTIILELPDFLHSNPLFYDNFTGLNQLEVHIKLHLNHFIFTGYFSINNHIPGLIAILTLQTHFSSVVSNSLLPNGTSPATVTWVRITTLDPKSRNKPCKNCTTLDYDEPDDRHSDIPQRRRRKRRRNKKLTTSDRHLGSWNHRRSSSQHLRKKYSTRVHLDKPAKFTSDFEEVLSTVPPTIPPPVRYLLPPFVTSDFHRNANDFQQITNRFQQVTNYQQVTNDYQPVTNNYQLQHTKNYQPVTTDFHLQPVTNNYQLQQTNDYQPVTNNFREANDWTDRGSTKFKDTLHENEVDSFTSRSLPKPTTEPTPQSARPSKSPFRPIVVPPVVEVNASFSNQSLQFVSPEVARAGMRVQPSSSSKMQIHQFQWVVTQNEQPRQFEPTTLPFWLTTESNIDILENHIGQSSAEVKGLPRPTPGVFDSLGNQLNGRFEAGLVAPSTTTSRDEYSRHTSRFQETHPTATHRTAATVAYNGTSYSPVDKKPDSFKGLDLAESSYFSELPSQVEVMKLTQIDVIPGIAGKDYPVYSQTLLRKRKFACRGLEGYFADISTRCQVFYICNGNGAGEPMLCPNGTLFSQELLVCDWWYNVDC